MSTPINPGGGGFGGGGASGGWVVSQQTKRWAPLISGLILALTQILRATGQEDLAGDLEVAEVQVTAAVVTCAGIALKVHSLWLKRRAGRDKVTVIGR